MKNDSLDMSQAIPTVVKNIINRYIHTSTIGKVISFNKDLQTADVIPLVNNKIGGDVLEYSKLSEVPVIFPAGGSASITFPLVKNDIGVLLFMERSIDEAYEKESRATPVDNRTFSLSDAIFLPSLKSTAQAYYDAVEIKNDLIKVTLRDNKVAIGTQAAELLDILVELINLLSTTTAGGYPLSSAVQLGLLATKLSTIAGVL